MTDSATFSKPDRQTILIALVFVVVIAGLLATAAVFLRDGTEDVAAAATDPSDFVASYAGAPLPSGITHELELTVAATTTELGRGQQTNVWSFNGRVPGPAIKVALGDMVRITVRNELSDATSVHWHGIRVPNDMDGVPGVNQDPILPGESFTYEFTPPDAGTYWYHSHQRGNEQLERGLYGSFVVQDPKPKPYSQDIVWMIDDWLLDESGQLDPDFDSSDDIHHNGRWGTDITVNGQAAPTLAARPGERIRLRLINASNARIYQLRLGDLDASAIAMDGLGVQKPLLAEGLELAPGNRVDLDITIPVDASGNYIIGDRFTGIDPLPLGTITVAGEPVEGLDFDPPTVEIPDWSAAFDWDPTTTFNLAIVGEELTEATGLAGDAEGTFRWTINGKSWPEPTVHTATQNQVEKLRFVNDSGAFHPMHLHGQFFQVVARNGEPVREGHYRDTVLLSAGDVVDIVVVPADAGVWALHCHIQLHAEYGMLALYEVT
jgi:FtsP/CotA-like multicopper oxidase with cupredoxin domain